MGPNMKGTIHHGLFLNRHSSLTLSAFSDSDWGGVHDTGRSTTAYLLYFGNNVISWKSTRQKSVSRSSTEAEYKAIANASAEMIWLKNLLQELSMTISQTPTLYCDNTGATYLCANPVYHSRMKHVVLDYHFVREQVSAGHLRVFHVSSQDQLAHIINVEDNQLFTVPTSMNCKGEEVVLFDEEMVKEGSEKWLLTVCGYLWGVKCMLMSSSIILEECGRYGLKDIVVDAEKMCFFKFKNEEGMKYIIDQSPWIVNGKPLIVQKWDPEIIIEKETPCKIPVWIRLYNVPLEPWSTKVISTISSSRFFQGSDMANEEDSWDDSLKSDPADDMEDDSPSINRSTPERLIELPPTRRVHLSERLIELPLRRRVHLSERLIELPLRRRVHLSERLIELSPRRRVHLSERLIELPPRRRVHLSERLIELTPRRRLHRSERLMELPLRRRGSTPVDLIEGTNLDIFSVPQDNNSNGN
ncbi:retrovirus-related pol polyprotein from transposon RE2 [Tanacetum coccineum]